jgi:molecular chaperone HtpG
VSEERKTFVPGIDFPSILTLLSKQIYETPLAFIRENVQNAVDAVRIQAFRERADPADQRYRIDVTVEGNAIKVRDNGTGMSAEDLQRFFWSMGASGKRTAEAISAGCVGMFGIGGRDGPKKLDSQLRYDL